MKPLVCPGKPSIAYRDSVEEAVCFGWIDGVKRRIDLAPGYSRQYAGWLASAVKPGTRAKRLREALQLLEQNKKLGMK